MRYQKYSSMESDQQQLRKNCSHRTDNDVKSENVNEDINIEKLRWRMEEAVTGVSLE